MAATSAWTADEVAKFLDSVADDRLRAAWWLFLLRGLRRGEVAGLRWANVDLDRGVLRIVETRVVVSSKPTPSEPKTDAGKRLIHLDDDLAGELRAHKTRQDKDRKWGARDAWEGTDYLFVDELGRPYRPETLSRNFTRLAKVAGLRPIRLHDARHTAASLLLADGEQPKVVAEMLGHSSPTITMNIYQHVMPGMAEAAGARLTGRITAMLGGANG